MAPVVCQGGYAGFVVTVKPTCKLVKTVACEGSRDAKAERHGRHTIGGDAGATRYGLEARPGRLFSRPRPEPGRLLTSGIER